MSMTGVHLAPRALHGTSHWISALAAAGRRIALEWRRLTFLSQFVSRELAGLIQLAAVAGYLSETQPRSSIGILTPCLAEMIGALSIAMHWMEIPSASTFSVPFKWQFTVMD